MTKYQKQLIVALPLGVVSFLIMYLTYPLMWVGIIFILPFLLGLGWTIGILIVMICQSKFGSWLSEDDK